MKSEGCQWNPKFGHLDHKLGLSANIIFSLVSDTRNIELYLNS